MSLNHKGLFLFDRKYDLLVGVSEEGAAPGLSWVPAWRSGMHLTSQPSAISHSPATMFSNSPTLNLVSPHFSERWFFWWPENLNLALQRASITCSLFCSLVQMDIMTWPTWTTATVPWGFPKAPHIPVWSQDWGQRASHECPRERGVSKVPRTTWRATGCVHYRGGRCGSHCTLGPRGEKNTGLFYRIAKHLYKELMK